MPPFRQTAEKPRKRDSSEVLAEASFAPPGAVCLHNDAIPWVRSWGKPLEFSVARRVQRSGRRDLRTRQKIRPSLTCTPSWDRLIVTDARPARRQCVPAEGFTRGLRPDRSPTSPPNRQTAAGGQGPLESPFAPGTINSVAGKSNLLSVERERQTSLGVTSQVRSSP